MKTITIIVSLLAAVFTTQASQMNETTAIEASETAIARSAMEREVARHFYYPIGQMKLTGEAEIMLRVLPEGNVELIMMNSSNDELKRFITKQLSKFRFAKDEVKAGEVYRYKLCFKRQA